MCTKKRRKNLPKFSDLCHSSVDLIAHGWNNIVNWDHALFIDQSFGPNFGIHFITSLQMLANVVLFLRDSTQFLGSVNIDSCLRLAKIRCTKHNTREKSEFSKMISGYQRLTICFYRMSFPYCISVLFVLWLNFYLYLWSFLFRFGQ